MCFVLPIEEKRKAQLALHKQRTEHIDLKRSQDLEIKNSIRKEAYQVVNCLCTKKHELSVTPYTSVRWVKPAWPTEPKVSIPTIPMGGPAGDAGIYNADWYKAKFFFC